jgi:nucleotide-binding universal stress UspA family protein
MTDITRILCPVDYSDSSRHALDHAIAMARWYRASITAVHVYEPLFLPVPEVAVAGYAGPFEKTTPSRDLLMRGLKEEALAWLRSATDMDLDVDVLIGAGSPVRAILDRARMLPADLIVLGTHGHIGFEHLVLGSVTEKILRQARCPVLTVPPRANATSKLPFTRLLCPVDFSDSSLAALEMAWSLARESDAALTILHVLEWSADEGPIARVFTAADYKRRLEQDAAARLQTLAAEHVDWCRPSIEVRHGKPYREILRVAAESPADVIVMGVHGRNPVDLMLLGSTTNQLARLATCPVLTMRG